MNTTSNYLYDPSKVYPVYPLVPEYTNYQYTFPIHVAEFTRHEKAMIRRLIEAELKKKDGCKNCACVLESIKDKC